MSDYGKGWKGSRPNGPMSAEYKKGWDARQRHINNMAGGPKSPKMAGGGGGCSTALLVGAVLATLVFRLWIAA